MTLYDVLERGTPAGWAAAAAVTLASVGLADALTGPDITFSLFYAIPVAMVGWRFKKGQAASFAIVTVILWQTLDFAKGRFSLELIVYAWQFGSRVLFFVALVVLMAALRSAWASERESSLHDYLTGTFNARAFYELADREIHRARRLGLPLTLIYLDVDDFKTVNDTRGHGAGDDLLKTVGRILTAGTRVSDLVSRIGGDEFAILLPQTRAGAAQMTARKLRAQLEESVRVGEVAVTCSLGVFTSYVTADSSVAELVGRADALMYSAKRGRDGIQVFDATAERPAVEPGRFARPA